MTTAVGSLDSATGTALTSLTLTAAASLGAIRICHFKWASATQTVATVSGGNCPASGSGTPGAWALAVAYYDNGSTVNRHEIWYGTVTNANATQKESISWTSSGSLTGLGTDLSNRTFDWGNTAIIWKHDSAAGTGTRNNTSSTTITYPSVTALHGSEVAVYKARAPSGSGYGAPGGTPASGWVTATDANGNPYIYNLSVGSGTVAPTQTSAATTSNTIGALFIATHTISVGQTTETELAQPVTP